MRELKKEEISLPDKLQDFVASEGIGRTNAYPVKTYSELLDMVAKLSYMNKDYILYFRGQDDDYTTQKGSSTFFPSIYRERLIGDEIYYRFEILNQASKLLVEDLSKKKLSGISISRKNKYIQWSILQHYEVCQTPLLDFTHSIRVACTFARLKNHREWGYFYVFALPYLTNRISINSEHEIVNVRLLRTLIDIKFPTSSWT